MAVQPAWLTPQVQPQQTAASPLTQPNPQQAATQMASGGQVPPYVNLNDPVQAAVWQSFQKKGITPRDQGDFQYWVDNINQTGGFGDAGNKQYWLDRMAQSSGGTGDYGQGSAGAGAGSPSGGPGGFSFDPNNLASNPTLKFITQQGINAIGANKASAGTVLGTGTGKDYIDYAEGAASQFEPIAFDQAQRTFQTNFGDLSQLYGTGFNALEQAGNYNTGASAAGSAGTIGANNAINRGIGNGFNAYQNAKLYSQFNPSSYGAS